MATVPNPTPPADPGPPPPAPPAPADPIPPTPSAGSFPASTEMVEDQAPSSPVEIKEVEDEQRDGQRDQLRRKIDNAR